MRILIATASKPTTQEKANAFNDIIRDSAKEGNLTIPQGIMWCEGPGCANLAFELIGDEEEAERFANSLTMHLGIAKWGTTTDSLPDVDTYACT